MTQTAPYQVANPATGQVVQTFAFATDAEVDAAMSKAEAAYEMWRDTPIEERVAVVWRIAALFSERAAELGALITEEMGKSRREAAGEAGFCSDIFGYYAENGPRLLADQPLPGHPGGHIQSLPLGPLLGVMPWNYPYYQVARFVAPNLVAGNTILLKHAENCPTSALEISRLFADAGLPEGVYTNLFATHDQVAAMIADPRVRGVSLTGSERAGAAVAQAAGRHLKKVVLELGGSDPYIVLDTDDLESSVETAWRTRMANMGQACNSNKRMIVMEDVYDAFVAGLVARAHAVGSARDYAPMVSRAAAEALAAQVQDAVDKGATLHAGGVLGENAWFSPAVLSGVTPALRAYTEELFGPVAVVYKVASGDEAVALANAVDFGLGASVWSPNEQRAVEVSSRLDVGMANVNLPAADGFADFPFGGTKRSGFGRGLGPLGIGEFLNRRVFYVGGSA